VAKIKAAKARAAQVKGAVGRIMTRAGQMLPAIGVFVQIAGIGNRISVGFPARTTHAPSAARY